MLPRAHISLPERVVQNRSDGPHRTLMAPKKDKQRQERCVTTGPLFSVQQNEQLGSWEEMRLYHYSLCVILCSIWAAVGG